MDDFARAAQRRGGVSFDDDLMPLLAGRGALVVLMPDLSFGR